MGKKKSATKKLLSRVAQMVNPFKEAEVLPPPLYPPTYYVNLPNLPSSLDEKSDRDGAESVSSSQMSLSLPKSKKRKHKNEDEIDSLLEIDDIGEEAFSIEKNSDGNMVQKITESTSSNQSGKSKNKRRRKNKYRSSSTSSEEPGVSNEPYNPITICDNFHSEIIVDTPFPANKDYVNISFCQPPTKAKIRDPFPSIREREFMELFETRLEDKLDNLNLEITEINTTLAKNKTSLIKREGKNRSLWIELVNKMKQAAKFERVGKWPSQEEDNKQADKCIEKLESALGQLKGYYEYLMLPTYIEFCVKQTRGMNYDPDKFFKSVSESPKMFTEIDCWNKCNASFLTHYNSFNVSSAIEKLDFTLKRCASACYATEVSGEIPYEKLHDIISKTIIYQSRLNLESGHLESIIVLLQALTEFYHCVPSDLAGCSFALKWKKFEQFFEEGCPRLGEDDSKGWSQHSLDGYNLSNKQANISKERALLEAINDKMRRQESEIISAFQNEQQTFEDLWSEIERLRSLACWRPLKFEHSDIENPSRFVGINEIKTSIEAVGDKKRSNLIIFKLLQILGASFGPMPMFIDKEILDNDSFSTLIATVLPSSHFVTFKRDNEELYDFLVSFMLQLCRINRENNKKDKDSSNLGYQLITGIFETLRVQFANCNIDDEKKGAILSNTLTEIEKIFGSTKKRESRLRLVESDYAKIKRLELLADITKCLWDVGYGFETSWLDLPSYESGKYFKKSEIFKELVEIVQKLGPIDRITDAQNKTIIFFAVLQILKRLSSSINTLGKSTFYSKARFLVLFLGVLDKGNLSDFSNKDIPIHDYDKNRALDILEHMFQVESHNMSTNIYSVMGSAKDLCFQLYALMYYEVKGRSLYQDKENQLLNLTSDDDKSNTKSIVYFKESFFFRFYRIELSESMVLRNMIPYDVYNLWALQLLKKHPYHQLVWQCALPTIGYGHRMVERVVRNHWCKSIADNYPVLHALLVFAFQYQSLGISEDSLPIFRSTLKKAEKEAKCLPFPDSTVARLRIWLEINNRVARESIQKIYSEVMAMFPYAKQCTFDVLPEASGMSVSQLNGIDNLLGQKGYRLFVTKEELTRMVGI